MNFHHKNLIGFTKWVSSLVIIAGMALTASNIYPLNMYMQLVGIIGWLVVALAWHDRLVVWCGFFCSWIILGVIFIFINGIIASLL